jgi:hypothetical protein
VFARITTATHRSPIELSARGVACPGGRDFDDPALFDFFAACVDLDVAVFVHPAAPLIGLDRMRRYYFPLIVGNPLETPLAISTLIFGAVLERLPRLRSSSSTSSDWTAWSSAATIRSTWVRTIRCGRWSRRNWPPPRARRSWTAPTPRASSGSRRHEGHRAFSDCYIPSDRAP